MLFLLSTIFSLVAELGPLGGHPQVLEQDSLYQRIALTDSTTMEVYDAGDSVLVVMTACAPQCSSCARIYNKEGQLLKAVTPPFVSIFPLATIQNGVIVWKDNDTWEYQ